MKIKISGMQFQNIDYRKLKPFQGQLKILTETNYSKLAKSFKEKGLFVPQFVWRKGDDFFLMDGHGRGRFFEKEGAVFIDAKGKETYDVPCIVIDAKNEKDAKEKLLLITSQFQTVTQEGFDEFTFDLDDEWLKNSVNFDVLNFEVPKDKEELKEDQVPEPPKDPITKLGDLILLGNHRLICGDSTNAETVKKLIGGGKPFIMVTDPPYGVEYDPMWREEHDKFVGRRKGKVQNDDRFDWADTFALFEGSVAYVWHAGIFAGDVAISLHKANFFIRNQIIWRKQHFVFGRGAYHWQHEPCQPPGTIVQTPSGGIPIENLKDGDGVISYDSYSSVITGKRSGRKIKVATRQYEGDLYNISVKKLNTKCTDGHQFTVRFSPDSSEKWFTYLMRRGGWWRVGMLRGFNSRGFGLSVRIEQEDADEAWIIASHSSKIEACCYEQVLSVKYGIPTTHWCTDRNVGKIFRSTEQIKNIYSMLDLEVMEKRAFDLLKDHGRREYYPLVSRDNFSERRSRRITIRIRACNIIENLMQVPVPHSKGDSFDWETITSVNKSYYNGPVYSLDVAVDHHYVADGIVTHNCWYAVRKGGKAEWCGDRTQSTIWDIQNHNAMGGKQDDSNTVHGTQKPLLCMAKPIKNHGKEGDIVYDPFLGSGTTLIAAEQLNRVCYGVELDPAYCDVIIERWENLSGKKAIRQKA